MRRFKIRYHLEKEHLKNRLANLRKALCLSQAAFAQGIDRSPSLISLAETGRTSIGDDTLEKICSVYSVNPEWLYTGEGKMLTIERPQINKEGLGHRIRQARTELELSRDKFAKEIGCTGQYIYSVENGRKTISNRLLRKVAEAFDIDYEWLLSGEGGMFKAVNGEVDDQLMESNQMKNIKNEKADKIRAIRLYLNLSKNAFAGMIGLSTTHISRLENGITEPGEAVLQKICSTFSVDKRYFSPDISPESISEMIQQRNSSGDGLTVGDRIRMIRESERWTQKQLADQAGCLQSLITGVERGKRTLTKEKALRIADALEMGVDYILYGDEEKKLYPLNDQLFSWLWNHENIRKKLWEEMKEDLGEK